MSVLGASRRRFLGQVAGVGVLSTVAGCTVAGTVRVEIIIENTGPQVERTEYHYGEEENPTWAETVVLDPGKTETVPMMMERGDVAVVSKGEARFECRLDDYFCRNPTIQADTGYGQLAVQGECFDISAQ